MGESKRKRGIKDVGKKGILYVIATPIGNLMDITIRAINILKEIDIIAAEDTRKIAALLKPLNISHPLTSYFEHNEARKIPLIIKQLEEGKKVALMVTAGTPTISDPGYRLIKEAISKGFQVIPIPGPSAAIAALSVSGLPSDSFIFQGFIPRKGKKRDEMLNELSKQKRTIILYESPYRIKKTLKDLYEVFGDRDTVIAREMTKPHEEFIRGTLKSILERIDEVTIKGEFTIVISGLPKKKKS